MGKRFLASLLCAALLLMGGCGEAELLFSALLPGADSDNPAFRTGGTGVTVRDRQDYPIVRSGMSLRQSDFQPIEESSRLIEHGEFSDELISILPEETLEGVRRQEVSARSSPGEVAVVPDDTANASLSVETTPNYPWPIHMMPYRSMLSDADKLVYDEIYRNISNMISHFPLQSYATPRSISPIVRAVIYDNPDLFWVDSYYQFGYTSQGLVTEVKIAFNSTAGNIQQAKQEFRQAANTIISGASHLESDWAKEKYVHDYLLDLVQYDLQAPNNQSAYSALVGRASVCAGYAKAFQYVMMRLGIPCYYCVGYAGEDHAWNLVQLDGQFYNVDVAWDDPLGNPQGQYHYNYYNLSDRDIAVDHRRTEMSVYLPAAPETARFFY